jgi:acyl carrier protein
MAVVSRWTQPVPAAGENFNPVEIRTLIAEHLDVGVERVADDAHFIKDLGADWLDHLELMIMIEDRFGGLEITEADADHIEVVGDLIHYVEARVNRRAEAMTSAPPTSTRRPAAAT